MVPVIPRWALLWALCLPAVAGAVNAVALMALHHGGVTHLTGVSTEGAIGSGKGDGGLPTHAAPVILLYAMGLCDQWMGIQIAPLGSGEGGCGAGWR